MAQPNSTSKRSVGWMGLKRGHRAHPFEWLAEKGILAVSLSTIVMIFLIFIFIGREALPVIFGQTNTALVQHVIPLEDMDKQSPEMLQDYLGLTPKQFASMDRATLQLMMQLKLDMVKQSSDNPDA